MDGNEKKEEPADPTRPLDDPTQVQKGATRRQKGPTQVQDGATVAQEREKSKKSKYILVNQIRRAK
jgi:hypothetical protein